MNQYLHFYNTHRTKITVTCFRWEDNNWWEKDIDDSTGYIQTHDERDELFCLLCQLIVRLFRLILTKYVDVRPLNLIYKILC